MSYMRTAQQILEARGKTYDPKGEQFGVTPRFHGRQDVAIVVTRLSGGRLVLDNMQTRVVGSILLSEKTGRRVIHPEDPTVIFQ
jgi:hypothetical protein